MVYSVQLKTLFPTLCIGKCLFIADFVQINVTCYENCRLFENRSIQVETQFSEYVINDLEPYVEYHLTGQLFNGFQYSVASSPLVITTKQSEPGPVSDVRLFDVTDQSVRIVWSPPVAPNGVIIGYEIQVYQVRVGSNIDKADLDDPDPKTMDLFSNHSTDPDTTEQSIGSLTQSTQYVAVVAARTQVGKGANQMFSFSSSVPPTLPEPPNNVNVMNVTSTCAGIQFYHVRPHNLCNTSGY